MELARPWPHDSYNLSHGDHHLNGFCKLSLELMNICKFPCHSSQGCCRLFLNHRKQVSRWVQLALDFESFGERERERGMVKACNYNIIPHNLKGVWILLNSRRKQKRKEKSRWFHKWAWVCGQNPHTLGSRRICSRAPEASWLNWPQIIFDHALWCRRCSNCVKRWADMPTVIGLWGFDWVSWAIGIGFQRTKVRLLWTPYAKVIRVQTFVGSWSKTNTVAWCKSCGHSLGIGVYLLCKIIGCGLGGEVLVLAPSMLC